MSDISYILTRMVKIYILLLTLGVYLFIVRSGDRYLAKNTKENVLSVPYWERNCVQIGGASSNHITFGFCKDLLNSLKSVKLIQGILGRIC